MEVLGAGRSAGTMREAVVLSSAQTPAATPLRLSQASPPICCNASCSHPNFAKPTTTTSVSLRSANGLLAATGNSLRAAPKNPRLPRRSSPLPAVVCGGLRDFVGGDLLGFDLDKWVDDVEKYGALAVYPPAEGGYEGRYVTRLKGEGYHFMNISARGLGDPEAYLTKVHGVRPPHLGKQAVARWYLPPEVDYRLSLLPKNSKGLVLWVLECKVLSRTELQYLALLPALRPNVKVIAECGTWRSYRWKPLTDVSGVPAPREATADAAPSS